MPIQTIDHYLIAPRSQEASQVKQQDTAKVPQEQGFLQVRAEHQEKQNAERTGQMKEAENKEERYDAREKGKGTYEHRGQKKKEKEKEKELRQSIGEGGSFLDIKI